MAGESAIHKVTHKFYFPEEVRQQLNKIVWGGGATVARKLREKGYVPDESATIEQVAGRFVMVRIDGDLVRVNLKGKNDV